MIDPNEIKKLEAKLFVQQTILEKVADVLRKLVKPSKEDLKRWTRQDLFDAAFEECELVYHQLADLMDKK